MRIAFAHLPSLVVLERVLAQDKPSRPPVVSNVALQVGYKAKASGGCRAVQPRKKQSLLRDPCSFRADLVSSACEPTCFTRKPCFRTVSVDIDGGVASAIPHPCEADFLITQFIAQNPPMFVLKEWAVSLSRYSNQLSCILAYNYMHVHDYT